MGSNPVMLVTAMIVALCLGGAALLAFFHRPRWALAIWCALLFFTPVWFGVQVVIFITPLTAVTIIAIASSFGARVQWTLMDTLVLTLFGVIFVGYIFGGSVWGHVLETLVMWLLPYIWGRLIASRVEQSFLIACLAVMATVAGAAAIIEFITSTNLFLLFPGASSSTWGGLRWRGGELRVEGAFGSSIALGGAMAISSVFILATRWPVWARTGALGIVGIAAALTFSRLGLIGFVLTVLLGLIFLGAHLDKVIRITVSIALAVGLIVGLPSVLEVLSAAGDEADGSADYRGELLGLVDRMAFIGLSPARERLPTGEDYFGGFRSIDSALILIGLRHGGVAVALLLIMLAIGMLAVLRRRANPAIIAVLAQIPALATVALITQYAAFLWFVAGVAVTMYTSSAGQDASARHVEHDRDSRELAGAT